MTLYITPNGSGGGGGGAPSGPAGGALTGTYPNPGVNVGEGALVTGNLPAAQVAPSGTNGFVLTTVLGVATWAASAGGAPTGAAGGNLSGTYPNPVVALINGASVPAAGALTPGNVLQVTGISALGYAPVNLAGGANFVTGALPSANQAPQTMSGDVTGTTAANTVAAISGASPIAITPSTFNWVTGATPNLSQSAAVSGAGTNFTITPQAPTTTGAAGSLVVAVVAPASTTAEAGIRLTRGGTTIVSIQNRVGVVGQGAIYLGTAAAAPSGTNFTIMDAGTSGFINNASNLNLSIAAVSYIDLSTNIIAFSKPLGGTSGVPFAWVSSPAITTPTTGTITLSAAQLATPVIPLAFTATGAVTVAIGGKIGAFLFDVSLLVLGANSLTFTNGAGSFVATTLVGVTQTLILVNCATAATLAVL